MKAFILKFWFRFFAVIDVLFAERFELRTFKNGNQKSSTNFDQKEIERAYRKDYK